MYQLLELESPAVHFCERLSVLRSIYGQLPLLYLLNSEVLVQIKSSKSTRELIINESWNKSIYDRRLRGNILVVGKTGCGKAHFLQKLGLNKLFGRLVKTEWVTGIEIDE